MAVTATPSAPSASLRRSNLGSNGPVGTSKFATVSHPLANKRVAVTKMTLTGTYVTGGFNLTPSDYGLKEIHDIHVVTDTNGSGGAGALPRLTTTGGTPVVKLYSDTTTELTNTTSVTNYVYTLWIAGV